jgi:hypothetical protein
MRQARRLVHVWATSTSDLLTHRNAILNSELNTGRSPLVVIEAVAAPQ